MLNFEDVVTAAVEGNFTDYLDINDLGLSLVSEILSSSVIINNVSLCLQALWFGADVNFKRKGLTPLCSAITNGTLEIVELLLHFKASTEITIPFNMAPAPNRRPMKDIVLALLKAEAIP